MVLSFARAHDAGVWQCLCAVLRIPDTSCEEVARLSASLPLALGGLGFRTAVRTSAAAHWASWADTLPMIHQRHPVVATRIVHALAQEVDSPVLGAVRRAAQELEGSVDLAGWAKGWLATRSGQSRGEAVPNNVGFYHSFHRQEGPRWLRTVYHCLVVCSWQLTLHWCLQCKAADRDGVALRRARRRKEQTFPVVLGLEVGGRWSKEARVFVQLLARARARSEPPVRGGWNKLGVCDGSPSFLVRLHEFVRLLCWSCEVVRVPTARCHRPTRWNVTTTTQGCVVDA